MTLLVKIQELLQQIEKVKPQLEAIGFKVNQSNAREAYAKMVQRYMTEVDLAILLTDDVVLNGNYPVPIRIYHPKPGVKLPVAVFIHGGGHTVGSVAVYDGVCRKMARISEQIIVAIDYRLSPEFAYPYALDDCKMAIRYLFKILDERKIAYRDKSLTLIGDSAGGALCASIVMDKEFVAVESITNQILIYPSLDYTLSLPSVNKFADGYLLEKNKMEWYFDNYFQSGEERKSKSPIYNEFYQKMPRTLVITASYDPLQDEGEVYYHNMIKVGAEAELIKVDGVIHAYLMLENLCKEECAQTYQEIKKFLE